MTMARKLTGIVSMFLVLTAGCMSPSQGPLDELVDIGTHSLHIHCVGAGNPTVVIDTGVGETYESWESVIESLAHDTRVCAYDRAGYGQSELGPMPRDGRREADELKLLLVNAGEQGPFLGVGHSLGGLNMQVFAARYPEQLAGLLLLDPAPIGWIVGDSFAALRELFQQETVAMRAAAKAARASSDPETTAQADFLEAVASEHEQIFGQTGRQVAAVRAFGQLPLVVFGATEPDPSFGQDGEAFRQFWNEESRHLAGRSGNGRFILAEGSSHHIHLDAPRLVIEIIREMVRETGSQYQDQSGASSRSADDSLKWTPSACERGV